MDLQDIFSLVEINISAYKDAVASNDKDRISAASLELQAHLLVARWHVVAQYERVTPTVDEERAFLALLAKLE